MKSKLSLLILIVLVLFSTTAQGEIKLSEILTDNMVLQRNTEVKLWGTASAGEKLTIITDWNNSQYTVICNEKGEWLQKVLTTDAGGPYTITISSKKEKITLKNILLGEVWLCSGQSNMEMAITGYPDQPINGSNDFLVDADNSNIRLFTINHIAQSTPKDTLLGKYKTWDVASAETVGRFSAVAYLYARQLQQKLHVPVGIVVSAWGGTRIEPWMSKESIAKFPEAVKRASNEKLQANARSSALYNGMIFPILNFNIKGVIWYQGESNKDNCKEYSELLIAMVENWRKDFGLGNFPFYFVQIAPNFYKDNTNKLGALLREQQLKAGTLIPNSGMVCTIDLGEEKIIHPAEKLTVAKRLSYWALSETYNVKGLYCKSPTYKSMSVSDSIVTLQFDNPAFGFSGFGKEVNGFEVAGSDKVFYPATIATNKKKQVLVSSPKVKNPVAVRYCFYNFPKVNGYLYNTQGLPLPSFRTDDWDQ